MTVNRRVWRILGSVAAVAVAAGGLTACGESGSAACPSGAEFKIASMGALSGPAAGLGEVMRDGTRVAVELYNKKHEDAPVCMVEFDSKGAEKDAPGIAKKIVKDESIVGTVGPGFSGETEASGKIFNTAGLPIISGSATNPTLAEKGWKVFHRTIGNDAVQGPAVASYVKDTIKAKKVFVVHDDSAYGQGLAESFTEGAGDLVVGTEQVSTGKKEFGPTVSKVADAKPDVVFFSGYYAEGGPLLNQLKKDGVEAQFIGPDGIKDPNFVSSAKDAAEDAIITCPCIPGEEAAGSFPEDFKKIIGKDAGTYGAEAYDAANVFLQGIEKGHTDRKAMLKWVGDYKGKGASKTIEFDDNGNIKDDVVWTYKVKDGEIVKNEEI